MERERVSREKKYSIRRFLYVCTSRGVSRADHRRLAKCSIGRLSGGPRPVAHGAASHRERAVRGRARRGLVSESHRESKSCDPRSGLESRGPLLEAAYAPHATVLLGQARDGAQKVSFGFVSHFLFSPNVVKAAALDTRMCQNNLREGGREGEGEGERQK